MKWKWNVPKEVWTEDNFVWCKQFIMFIPKVGQQGRQLELAFGQENLWKMVQVSLPKSCQVASVKVGQQSPKVPALKHAKAVKSSPHVLQTKSLIL